MAIILVTIIIVLLWHSYGLYKQRRANKELNELYMKRFGEQARVERLIEEKPGDNILATDVMASEITLRYIGRIDNLEKVNARNGDYAYKDGREYMYKDGKWFEIANDLPPRIDYGYRITY